MSQNPAGRPDAAWRRLSAYGSIGMAGNGSPAEPGAAGRRAALMAGNGQLGQTAPPADPQALVNNFQFGLI